MAAEGNTAAVVLPSPSADENLLPPDIRDKLAELDLELSEGKRY